MRKSIAILSLVVLAMVSCKKEKTFNPESNNGNVPPVSMSTDPIPGPDVIHDVIFKHDTAFFKASDTYYTIAKRVATTFNMKYGYYLDPDTVASDMLSYGMSHGLVRPDGIMVGVDTLLQFIVDNEADIALRGAYQTFVDSVKNNNASPAWFTLMLKTTITPGQWSDEKKDGVGKVFTMSNVYVMGQTMPQSISAADALGFSMGWDYSANNGGGRPLTPRDPGYGHPINNNMYWAVSFSIMCSEAVACLNPNSVP